VFPDKVIGDANVFYQSETISGARDACINGDYTQWQAMAKLCEKNPVLVLALCVSLSGPLLAKTNGESGGVHFHNISSTGKTTALRVGASVWGNGRDGGFLRSWRGTANGLEGIAATLSDTCFCIDEIHQANKKEVGEIVYMLANGVGKSRATRSGGSRAVSNWKLSILSSGENSAASMVEGKATAG
jgi:putative DNA primase/helicase